MKKLSEGAWKVIIMIELFVILSGSIWAYNAYNMFMNDYGDLIRSGYTMELIPPSHQ